MLRAPVGINRAACVGTGGNPGWMYTNLEGTGDIADDQHVLESKQNGNKRHRDDPWFPVLGFDLGCKHLCAQAAFACVGIAV